VFIPTLHVCPGRFRLDSPTTLAKNEFPDKLSVPILSMLNTPSEDSIPFHLTSFRGESGSESHKQGCVHSHIEVSTP
jgi:hypothetical protein